MNQEIHQPIKVSTLNKSYFKFSQPIKSKTYHKNESVEDQICIFWDLFT